VGEGSRKYRRTVYTHDDWVRHRSPDRFGNNLSTLFNSGIYKQVANEVFATTAVATFVFLWNMIAGGYTDLAGVQHGPIIDSPLAQMVGLPMTAFTILTPSLGLLLGE
jgi:putative membrane protein